MVPKVGFKLQLPTSASGVLRPKACAAMPTLSFYFGLLCLRKNVCVYAPVLEDTEVDVGGPPWSFSTFWLLLFVLRQDLTM